MRENGSVTNKSHFSKESPHLVLIKNGRPVRFHIVSWYNRMHLVSIMNFFLFILKLPKIRKLPAPPPSLLLRSGEYVHKYLLRRCLPLWSSVSKYPIPESWTILERWPMKPFFPYGDMGGGGGVWVRYLMFSYRKIGSRYLLFIGKISLYSITFSWTIKTWK